MSRRCEICESTWKAKEVERLLECGTSLRKTAELAGTTLSKVRTHKSHAQLFVPPADAETNHIDEVLKQQRRLRNNLVKAREKAPDDFELYLKFEQRISENVKLLASMQRDEKLKDDAQKESTSDAQIASLTSFLVDSLSKYPDAQKALYEALKTYNNNNR